MKRLIAGFLLLALLPLSGAVTRTGVNSVKIPLAPGNVRISCPECSIIEPPPAADLTVCAGGACDYLNTTAGLSSAIAAIGNGDTIELRNQTPGSAEIWSARIIILNTDGASGSEKTIRVRDGDTVTLSTTTSNFDGLVDIQGSDYWIIQGTSTGSGTDYLTNGLRIGNRALWTTTCNGLSCMPNRRGLNVYNSTHLTFKNISFTGGNNAHANLTDGATNYVLFKNFVFDKHGTNNTGTGNDSGDLTRFYSDHTIFEDGTFSHGGHDNIGARGPHQIFRRIVFSGDWSDIYPASVYTGNHSVRFNNGQAKNESNGLYALQTAYGPFLVEDSIFTGAGQEPEHYSSHWNQVIEFWAVGGIMRGTYSYGHHIAAANAGGVPSWATQCSPSGSGAYLSAYMDAHAIMYHNSTYGTQPHEGGGAGWPASANAGVCERMNVINNVFMGVPTGTKSGHPWAWDELRANIPLGGYANSWKGSILKGNIFGGNSANMQFHLAGTGGATVTVTDSTTWASNVFQNENTGATGLLFANGTNVPTQSKAGMALAASNAIGVGDALNLTTTTDSGTADTTLTLAEPYLFKDNWGITYTFGGNHTEYGDCIAVGAAVSTAAAAAAVTRITSINYTSGAIVVTPAVTHVAGSKVWKATDNGDGTCGPVWANRGANQ